MKNDNEIVDLYLQRHESAIAATEKLYGPLLRSLSMGILCNNEDAEEVLEDTYMQVWNSIPPVVPKNFRAYICRIARNLALNRLKASKTVKRGGEYVMTSYEELDECLPDNAGDMDDGDLAQCLNSFLAGLKKEDRVILMKRYWVALSVEEIARQIGRNEKYVTNKLFYMKKKLRAFLVEKGEWL